MTDEVKRQADELTDKIEDIIRDRTDGYGAGVAAAEIVRQLPQLLYQEGWLPPETDDQVRDWITRTLSVPDHHVSRDTWNSHLAELTAILHSR